MLRFRLRFQRDMKILITGNLKYLFIADICTWMNNNDESIKYYAKLIDMHPNDDWYAFAYVLLQEIAFAAYIPACLHSCLHTYIHTYMHTYIHTYT